MGARTRLAADVGKQRTFSGLYDCLYRTATGPAGPRGLYTGFKLAVVDVTLYRSIQLGCFDTLYNRKDLNPDKESVSFSAMIRGFGLALASTSAAVCVAYPLDTTRRRLMMDADRPAAERVYKSETGDTPSHRRGIGRGSFEAAVRLTLKEDGIAGFYKGVTVSFARSGSSSLVPLIYEKIKVLLRPD